MTTSHKWPPNQNPDWFLCQSNNAISETSHKATTSRMRPPKPDITYGRFTDLNCLDNRTFPPTFESVDCCESAVFCGVWSALVNPLGKQLKKNLSRITMMAQEHVKYPFASHIIHCTCTCSSHYTHTKHNQNKQTTLITIAKTSLKISTTNLYDWVSLKGHLKGLTDLTWVSFIQCHCTLLTQFLQHNKNIHTCRYKFILYLAL